MSFLTLKRMQSRFKGVKGDKAGPDIWVQKVRQVKKENKAPVKTVLYDINNPDTKMWQIDGRDRYQSRT